MHYCASTQSQSKSYGGGSMNETTEDQETFEEEEDVTDLGDYINENVGQHTFILTKEGDLFKTDFDNLEELKQKLKEGVSRAEVSDIDDTDQPPTKKKKIRNMLKKKKHTSHDLTEKQYEENYWKENDYYKLDGSTAMMETRISKCQEAKGKSREECAKEVKTRMKKAGSENTNTEDLMEDAEDKKTEVCKDKLDFLEKFYEENKEKIETIEEQKKDMKERMDLMETDYNRWKESEAKKLVKKLDKKVKQYSEDFVMTEEKIRKDYLIDPITKKDMTVEKALAELKRMRKLATDLGTKPESSEEEEKMVEYNAEDFMTDFEKQKEEALAEWRHK